MKLKKRKQRLNAPSPGNHQARASTWREPSSTSRGYNYEWQCARLDYLRIHPFCVMCAKRGVVAAATVVDHVIPHKGNRVLFWDESNWQALCATCHSSTKQRIERANATRAKPTRNAAQVDATRVGGLKVQPTGDT